MLDRLFMGAAADDKLFVEDVFSTYLYRGNGSTQTIDNGIDLAGKGGLVWTKLRSGSSTYWHSLADTNRGVGNILSTNDTIAQFSQPLNITGFTSTGFTMGGSFSNTSDYTFASWTFRKAPKFFDVVTWTGNGVNGRTIAHSLGTTPGFIIYKCTSTAADWLVLHRSLLNGFSDAMTLNTTDASFSLGSSFAPTATTFTMSNGVTWNQSGQTYVAYLYAHDTTADSLIQCGSFTTDGSGAATVNLGWEPQWLLYKRTDATQDWVMLDNMRGFSQTNMGLLNPNTSAAETQVSGNYIFPTATGFQMTAGAVSSSATYIYMAIRRPMKTPTLGTSVFAPVLASSSDTAGTTFTTNFPIDMQATRLRIGDSTFFTDRLRGVSSTSAETGPSLRSNTTAAESTTSPAPIPRNWNNTGFQLSSSLAGFNMVNWNFRRAPGFFDEVCYTGNDANGRSINHNLGVVPELIITKARNTTNWWLTITPSDKKLGALNSTMDFVDGSAYFQSASASAYVINAAGNANFNLNSSTINYVAYLFASCPGVSKVGSYIGTGESDGSPASGQTINCGFSNGARFVLIKATNNSGDWYVFDTARGITNSASPWLSLNTASAESAGTGNQNYVEPHATGFSLAHDEGYINQCNYKDRQYIFLAIA